MWVCLALVAAAAAWSAASAARIRNEGLIIHEVLGGKNRRLADNYTYDDVAGPAEKLKFDPYIGTTKQRYKSEDRSWGIVSRTEWMKFVNDSRLVTQMALPGTHDSAAYELKLTLFSIFSRLYTRTVSHNIGEQLIMGIRFLDLRVKVGNCMHNSRGKPCLLMYHGTEQLRHSLEHVFGRITAFLQIFPSEGIIVRIKDEKEDGGTRASVLCSHLDAIIAKMALVTQRIVVIPPTVQLQTLKMADLRGKLFILREYKVLPTCQAYQLYLTTWRFDKFEITDTYTPEIAAQERIKRLDDSDKYCKFTFCVTFISGTGKNRSLMKKYFPYTVAHYINRRVTHHLEMMDKYIPNHPSAATERANFRKQLDHMRVVASYNAGHSPMMDLVIPAEAELGRVSVANKTKTIFGAVLMDFPGHKLIQQILACNKFEY